MIRSLIGLWLPVLATGWLALADAAPPPPLTVTDYDENDWYLVRGGEKRSYHGLRESWVFNRAMTWLDERSGIEGAILAYSSQSPLPLSGKTQVSRWYAGPGNEVVEVDDRFTRFIKKNTGSTWDHACLPPVQFQIDQHTTAEFEVREATRAWQFVAVVKGRSGPPLHVSPWQTGPSKLRVDLWELYRQKGYDHRFAEMVFFVAVWTQDPKEQAAVVFRLALSGAEVVVPTLPVIRTAARAEAEGVPIYAVVLDRKVNRLGPDAVEVTASLGQGPIKLAATSQGVWKTVVRGVRPGEHRAELRATWKDDSRTPAVTRLIVRVTDGQFVGYDPERRLLTRAGKHLGPITGSYRGQSVFSGMGTARESLLHGQDQWAAAIADREQPNYGFHFWESLTPQELEQDYAYLQRCGWRMIHLCSAWLWWPRFDAAGRLSPFYAEQIDEVCRAAGRHGLFVHLAVSHYPLGQRSPPYAQYLEAGYQRSDYGNPQSEFFRMFAAYLAQFAGVFRDETVLSSFTPAGEGDPACGLHFVNLVHDSLARYDGHHLVMAEPHHQITQHPNFYRQAGWKPVLGGMRTYFIDRAAPEAIGAQFKLAAMGDLFMGEGCFYGFLGGHHQYMNPEMPIDSYRRRVRETIYTGLAYRNPILLTWEERIVEDERIVFEQIRKAIDWSTPFQRPPLAIRVDSKLMPVAGRQPLFRYEQALSRVPLEASYVWEDEPVPPGTVATLDARQPFVQPAFASDGGPLPDQLKSRMPLALPDGWAAHYSWSECRRMLLAFLRRTSSDAQDWNTAEGGDYTYVDTTLQIERDQLIEAWEAQCLKPGMIQLRIYRREGDELRLVGQSEMVEMSAPGCCRFTLQTPIAAKPGDLLGCYIPGKDTEIAARHGGRVLFVQGAAAPRSAVADWQTEAKIADLAVIDKGDPPRPPASPAGVGLRLQNFPTEDSRFQLFDLAARKPVLEGDFRQTRSLTLPWEGNHFFLLVLRGQRASTTTLAKDGEPAATIVIAAGAIPSEQTAADELADYLHQISGAAFRVQSEDQAPAHGSRVYVGPTAFARSQGLAPETLAPEEWIIHTLGNDLIILGGRPRGTLYGAYHFLEDVLGVHWWNPFEEYVPQQPTVQIDSLKLQGKPVIQYRDLYMLYGHDGGRFAARNRLNRDGDAPIAPRYGGARDYGPPYHVHTFHQYFPPRQYFAAHPEWYSLVGGQRVDDGQLCLTQPELRRALLEKLLHHIDTSWAAAKVAGTPPPAVFSVSQNDCLRPCECAHCQVIARREESECGPLLDFVNFLADGIKGQHPDVLIDTLAYQYTQRAPKTIRPHDNVIVRLCDTESDPTQPITSPTNQAFREHLSRWAQIARNLRVWDYAVTYANPVGMPMPTAQTYGPDYRFYAEHNVEGVFTELEFEILADLRDFKVWILMKQLEDPFADYAKLVRVFTDGFYGPAGKPIRQYLTELEQEAVARRTRADWNSTPTSLTYLNSDFIRRAQELFEQAERAVAGDVSLLRRVRHARLPLDRATVALHPRLTSDWLAQGKPAGQAPPDRSATARRVLETWLAQARLRLPESAREKEQQQAEAEMRRYASLPQEWGLPEKFRASPQGSVYDYTATMMRNWADVAKVVQDPEAETGIANRLDLTADTVDRADKYGLPMSWGLYATVEKTFPGGATIHPEDIPGPGYHWYPMGSFPIALGNYVYFFWSWIIQVDVDNAFDPAQPDQKYDVWARIKFTGPRFPHGRPGERNAIFVERLVLVKSER